MEALLDLLEAGKARAVGNADEDDPLVLPVWDWRGWAAEEAVVRNTRLRVAVGRGRKVTARRRRASATS